MGDLIRSPHVAPLILCIAVHCFRTWCLFLLAHKKFPEGSSFGKNLCDADHLLAALFLISKMDIWFMVNLVAVQWFNFLKSSSNYIKMVRDNMFFRNGF